MPTFLRLVDIVLVASIILIVRPATGFLGLLGLRASIAEKLTNAFFGILGVGSFYFLAYGLNRVAFANADRLWAIVGLAVLISILLHDLTVTPAMRWLDRNHGRDPNAGKPADEQA